MNRTVIILLLFLTSIEAFGQNHSDSILKSYDRYWEITPGTYRVMTNGYVGIIASNKLVIPCEYQQIWNLGDQGYYRVLKNGKTGVYHLDKGIIIPPEYDQIWDFKNGIARVQKNGKIGYFNLNGQIVVPCEYQQIWEFRDGMARVMRDGKVGYVNLSGLEFIPCIYQQINDFENGMAKVVRDGKIGFIDMNGNEIIPCDYQQIMSFENGQAKVVKSGKIGVIDTKGQTIIPPIFSQIWPFEGDSAKAMLNGSMVYIDQEGKVLSTIYTNTSDNIVTNPDIEFIEKNIDTIKSTTEYSNSFNFGNKNFKFNDDNDNFQLEITKENHDDNERKPSFKGHLMGIDLGFNSYVTSTGSTKMPAEYNFLELNSSKSIGVNVHFIQESIQLIPSGNIGFVTGLGFEFNNYRFDSPYILIINEEGRVDSEYTDKSVLKNKLATVYLDWPLLLEFQISPQSNNHPLYASFGLVGGVRLKSLTKVVYNNQGSKDKEKTKDNYNLQDFRYGVMARAGYRFVNLYFTYYFSPLFKYDADPTVYPTSIGFSFIPNW